MEEVKTLYIYTDGASRGNPGPSGIGIIIYDKEKNPLKEISKFLGKMTNNMAEYEAIKEALKESLKFRPEKVRLYSDSELAVSQLNGTYKVKNPKLALIYNDVKELIKRFKDIDVELIPREKNAKADLLANLAIEETKGKKEENDKTGEGTYILTVKDSFDAAHYLVGYPGKCVNLHGHTWDIEVSIGGNKLNEIDLLYDFRDLKEDLRSILSKLDHKYLNEIPPFDKKSPTAENLAYHLFHEIKEKVPGGLRVLDVKVWESTEACVSYREE